jgi:lysophospholipase
MAKTNVLQYDITPFEFGAWGGSVSSFFPTQYLGTRLHNGSVVNDSSCVVGFDRGS